MRTSSPISLDKQLKLPSDTQILKTGGGVRLDRDLTSSPVITLPTGLTIGKLPPPLREDLVGSLSYTILEIISFDKIHETYFSLLSLSLTIEKI